MAYGLDDERTGNHAKRQLIRRFMANYDENFTIDTSKYGDKNTLIRPKSEIIGYLKMTNYITCNCDVEGFDCKGCNKNNR